MGAGDGRGPLTTAMTEPPVTRFPLAKREIGGSALMECVRLRTKVVDSTRGKITLRSGQGDNDRTTILPESIREQMKHTSNGWVDLSGRIVKQICGVSSCRMCWK